MEAAGWQAEAVPRADRALEKLGDMHPDVILSDVRMPGMSGMELHKPLNEVGARLPILFVTGHGDVPMAVEAMRVGAFVSAARGRPFLWPCPPRPLY